MLKKFIILIVIIVAGFSSILGYKNDNIHTGKIDIYECFEDLQLENYGRVDKNVNPWGYTIAKTSDKGIVMMPKTTMAINYKVENNDTWLMFRYSIHPWVVQLSDGLILNVSIYDYEKNIKLLDKNVDVYLSLAKKEAIDLTPFIGKSITIKLSVNDDEYTI